MKRDLLERDRAVVWHPYTQHGLGREPLPVVSAQGAYLNLASGQRVLDGISSWWVNIHGHAHPRIVKAIAEQAAKLEHVIFAGFTHEPAVALAEILVRGANRTCSGSFSRAFFSDNGSTAVEVALKMAYQSFVNQGKPERPRFLALRNSYHGDTFGAMAVGEPNGFHSLFRGLLPQVDFVEPSDLEGFERLLAVPQVPYAAFIFEPLIQAAGGMRVYSHEFLKSAIELCRKKGVITIADEVFTGFYRTGTLFAFEQIGATPDLLCLSKGITGGFLPLSATLATDEIYSAFLSKDVRQAFLHGHSYTANPIACAAALESWAMLEEPGTQERIRRIGVKTSERVARIKAQGSNVKSARSLGTIGAVEIDSSRTYFNSPSAIIAEKAIAKGVLIRPLGNVLYAVPPYCVTGSELDRIYDVIEEILHEL